MNIVSYEKGLQLRVEGTEKLIQNWSSQEGAYGKRFSYDISDIIETHSYNTEEVGELRLGEALIETIERNIFISFDNVYVNDDGYITVTAIEDGDANQVDDSVYEGDMYICDYTFYVTINGIAVKKEDLEEILSSAGIITI